MEPIKKILICYLTLIIICITLLIFLFKEFVKEINIVEQYCATAYSHNVTNYKACRQLTQAELIKKLIKDFNKKNEVPTLEIIK